MKRAANRATARQLWAQVERIESDNPAIITLALELSRASAKVRSGVARKCIEARRDYQRAFEESERRTAERKAMGK